MSRALLEQNATLLQPYGPALRRTLTQDLIHNWDREQVLFNSNIKHFAPGNHPDDCIGPGTGAMRP